MVACQGGALQMNLRLVSIASRPSLVKSKSQRKSAANWVLPGASAGLRTGYKATHCCCNSVEQNDEAVQKVSRRCFLAATICAVSPIGVVLQNMQPAHALPFPLERPESVLARLNRSAPGEPKRKVYANDLFYPDYFLGTWSVRSTLISVQCPAGYKMFGRPGSFEEAQKTINSAMVYKARFVKRGASVVSDRTYNVQSIAEAAMGPQSVLYRTEFEESPHVMQMSIRPNLADGNIFSVKLHVIARQQETIPLPAIVGRRARTDGSDIHLFDIDESNDKNVDDSISITIDSRKLGLLTSETVHQKIMLKSDDIRVAPQIKEVETTTLFELTPDNNDVLASWQRTCTYVPKSDLRYIDTKGRPVDVRWYELQYVRDS